MRLTKLFNEFFESEKAGGQTLVIVTIGSLLLANSPYQELYSELWKTKMGGHEIAHWINEGLMTIFFLLVGLELERELYKGELSSIKKATLPILGALGGMAIPPILYAMLNWNVPTLSGAGIPMATDIAFAIGVLSLLGNRIPPSLKIFLTALAVIDDLGAIIVIATFYASTLHYTYLVASLGIFCILLILNRLRVFFIAPYLIGGGLMWYLMTYSGVHASITGVMLAFAIPFRDGKENSPSSTLQHLIHKPVAFIVLPLFAAANTCLVIDHHWAKTLVTSSSLGIILGLVLGKPIGIGLFSFIGVKARWCELPSGLNWKNMLGAGILGGIGFTMSIFMTLLSFNDETLLNNSKIAILLASTIAGIMGFSWLYFTSKKSKLTIFKSKHL